MNKRKLYKIELLKRRNRRAENSIINKVKKANRANILIRGKALEPENKKSCTEEKNLEETLGRQDRKKWVVRGKKQFKLCKYRQR